MIRPSQPVQRSVNALYACLGSEDGRGLRYAIALLDETKAAAADCLADLLHADLQRLRHSRRQQTALASLTIALFMCAQARLLLDWHVPPACGLLCLAPGIFLMQSLIARGVAQRMTRRRIVNVLFLLQDEACVAHAGIVVDVMRYGDSELSYLAQTLLVQILPRMQDADLLTRSQHAALCRALRGTNANLILAILAAFQKIGAASSLRGVRRLTSCPAWLANARQIESAANACLQAMQERAAKQKIARTLLRSPTSIAYARGTLLHPARSVNSPRGADLPATSAAGGDVRDMTALLQTASSSGEKT